MTDAVWPDGAREAVQAANEQGFVEHYTVAGGYNKWADGILTALEPFVQQRIEKATVSARAKITAQCNELANLNEVMQRKNRELDALGMVWCDGGCHSGMHRWQSDPPTAVTIAFLLRNAARAWHWFVSAQGRLSAGGHPIPIGTDMGPHWDKARSQVLAAVNEQSEAEVVQLRAEVARLREDGERLGAVLRLCAGDVVTCYPRDDGTVTVAVNLNDYFVPASDGEEIALADAPTLVALMDRGGWPAIYQWVADRRGVPNQQWRQRLDAARSARGGEG